MVHCICKSCQAIHHTYTGASMAFYHGVYFMLLYRAPLQCVSDPRKCWQNPRAASAISNVGFRANKRYFRPKKGAVPCKQYVMALFGPVKILPVLCKFSLTFSQCFPTSYTGIFYFSIYQSYRYPFSRELIGSRSSWFPRLLVDFAAEVKLTGSARAKNRKKGLHWIVSLK